MKLTFFDIETTGLNPEKHEIIELAAIQVDPDTLDVWKVYSAKTIPVHLERAEPRALQINGYNEDDWCNALPLKVALSEVFPLLHRCIPGGHNVNFDVRFLTKAYASEGLADPEFQTVTLDTQTLAKDLKTQGYYPIGSLSLDSVTSFFGVARPNPHRAYDDALACVEVVRKVKKIKAERAERAHG